MKFSLLLPWYAMAWLALAMSTPCPLVGYLMEALIMFTLTGPIIYVMFVMTAKPIERN